MMNPITSLTIKGFKSIRSLENLRLSNLNVLIGANGSGKSNLVSCFEMLEIAICCGMSQWTALRGGADRIVTFGTKETQRIECTLKFAEYDTFVTLIATDNDSLVELIEVKSISTCSWRIYHFHDTSNTAGARKIGSRHDSEYLRPDASNLAAFLYRLFQESPDAYQKIRQTIQLALPFFDDFVLQPKALSSGEEQLWLTWRQRGSDYPFWPSQLSDGALRFICLATTLLQPNPPSTIIIDEPELGLHPYAITLLGALLRSASTRTQIIVSTQSISLLNEFSVDDVIVVERDKKGASEFKRLKEEDFKIWLEDYSVGELWEKNVLGGILPA